MASVALDAFVQARVEVAELARADRTFPGRPPIDPDITRVVGRASVVLLSSHFERYIYAVNEEATSVVNATGPPGPTLPERLRLLHSRSSVEDMVETSWEHRGNKLRAFVKDEAWLWGAHSSGPLDHERLLTWMKAPTPKSLVRYYRYWQIEDIFAAVTRAAHTNTELQLRIEELVRKRNNIAHGDSTTEATRADIRAYRETTLRFCERSDRILARALARMLGGTTPW